MVHVKADSRSREELIEEIAVLDVLEERRPLSREDRVVLDPAYLDARRVYEAVSGALLGAASGSKVEPPASLRDRMLERIASEAQAAPAAPPAEPPGTFHVKPGVYGVRTDEADWLPSPVPGLVYKTIHRDAERGYTTRLLRIEPGHPYPPHRHGGDEEIFMLEGTLWVNGLLLKPGDYCRSEAGTEETGTVSDTGALAIVISSDQDEVVAPETAPAS
jgi:quercetin dioxygenase-like cupin family protein